MELRVIESGLERRVRTIKNVSTLRSALIKAQRFAIFANSNLFLQAVDNESGFIADLATKYDQGYKNSRWIKDLVEIARLGVFKNV